MTTSVGILAFGSLIDDPGSEIAPAIISRKNNVLTPFGVEFARSSRSRACAPTLVPMTEGAIPVSATLLIVKLTEQEAADCLWRREIHKVGQGGKYDANAKAGPNTLIIDRHEDFEGVCVALSTRFPANISPLTAEKLADLAILSAKSERSGRDRISYLKNAKRNGLATRLSVAYEAEILLRTGSKTLDEALSIVQSAS